MFLNEVFEQMGICAEYIGCQEFETLGLVQSDGCKKVCTFIDNNKFSDNLSENICIIITTTELSQKLATNGVGLCILDNPRKIFFQLHNFLSSNRCYTRENFKTIIGVNARLSESTTIADSNVVIGDNVIIEEHVIIRENVNIGNNTIIRAGCIVGGEGFEFKRNQDIIMSVKHLGGVFIGKNVELQYNTCIDKAVYPWDNTVLGDYVKVDNMVHIAHAVKIGEGTMIVANSGIGGRTQIGKQSWIGFNSTVRNGLVIGDNVRINMGAVVTKNVKTGGHVTGNFAIPHDVFIKNIKHLSKVCGGGV